MLHIRIIGVLFALGMLVWLVFDGPSHPAWGPVNIAFIVGMTIYGLLLWWNLLRHPRG